MSTPCHDIQCLEMGKDVAVGQFRGCGDFNTELITKGIERFSHERVLVFILGFYFVWKVVEGCSRRNAVPM